MIRSQAQLTDTHDDFSLIYEYFCICKVPGERSDGKGSTGVKFNKEATVATRYQKCRDLDPLEKNALTGDSADTVPKYSIDDVMNGDLSDLV